MFWCRNAGMVENSAGMEHGGGRDNEKDEIVEYYGEMEDIGCGRMGW